MTTDTTDTYTLCLLSKSEATHIMMGAAVAGGWIAVDDSCRTAVELATNSYAGVEFLALLPSTWPEAGRRPVDRGMAGRITDRLRRIAAVIHAPEATEIARRVTAHLGDVATDSPVTDSGEAL